MTKRFRYLAILLSLALVLMACQLTQQVWKQPAEPASAATASREKDIPTEKASQTGQADPAETQAPEKTILIPPRGKNPRNPRQPKSGPKKCAQS